MLDRGAIVSTLQHACAARASCVIVLPGEGACFSARFCDVGGGSVLIDLLPHDALAAIRVAQVVCITFAHPRGSCCFMTRVLAHQPSAGAPERARAHQERVAAVIPGGARIRVTLPETMSGIDGRLSFRVPVEDRELELELDDPNGMPTRAEVIDVCIGGAQIELSESMPPLELRQLVRVVLRLRGVVYETAAEVRRRSDRRYGLFFADVLRDGRVVPPMSLARIVRELERRWLERRRTMARR